VIDTTPEFASYKRAYAGVWGTIETCIDHIATLMSMNAVPVAIVDGKKLADLAGVLPDTVFEGELLACLANLEQVYIVYSQDVLIYCASPILMRNVQLSRRAFRASS
jgi:hypothetical protein